jgi:hypothetical protein
MLNYYKNSIWTVYDTLSKKEWEMRFIPDQQFSVPENLAASERTARTISNSIWQTEHPLNRYFNAKQGTVLCISSLTDPRELQHVLGQSDNGTVIYFVQLSNTFRHFAPLTWLKRIIFLSPEDRLSRLRGRWTFSTLRIQIQRNEKEIKRLLDSSDVVKVVL